MELIRQFAPDTAVAALTDWLWLPGLVDLAPLAFSAFGDAFLYAPDGVWFLDTIEGTLTREWNNPAEVQDALNTLEGEDRFLLGGLVHAAAEAGIEPSESEVLAFKVAPILGGAFEADNIAAYDFEVALSLAGQLHRQLKDLPPGTSISEFVFEPPE